MAGATRAATLPLWRGRAKPVRHYLIVHSAVCHDVSVIGVWRLGLGAKTAILTIRPW
jgi:hypothetical protein